MAAETTEPLVRGRSVSSSLVPEEYYSIDRPGELVAVAFSELQGMAAAGTLKRREYVQKLGEKKWRRAGRIPGLCPPLPALTAAELDPLATCKACKAQVAKDAPHCPKCGVGNPWTHREIARFLDGADAFRREYAGLSVEYCGTKLVVKSVFQGDVPEEFFTFTSLGPTTVVGSRGKSELAKIMNTPFGGNKGWSHSLTINFQAVPPRWSSTDNEFWGSVLDFFDVL